MWCSPLKGYGIFAEHFYWLPLVFFNFLSLKIRLSLKFKKNRILSNVLIKWHNVKHRRNLLQHLWRVPSLSLFTLSSLHPYYKVDDLNAQHLLVLSCLENWKVLLQFSPSPDSLWRSAEAGKRIFTTLGGKVCWLAREYRGSTEPVWMTAAPREIELRSHDSLLGFPNSFSFCFQKQLVIILT